MIIYHYIKVEVFEKILSTYSGSSPYLQLRPSHCLFLNDIYENINSLCVIPHFISELEDELLIEEEYRVDKFFKNENIFRLLMIDRTSFNPKFVSYLENFIISFSKNGDCLPMWNTYSEMGKGICLGFDSGLLLQCIPPANLMAKECKYYDFNNLEKVRFKEEEIYKDCKTFYLACINPKVLNNRFLVAEANKGYPLTEEEKYNIRISSVMRNLNSFGSFFVKEKSWAYEEEYRILLSADKKDIRYYRNEDCYVPYIYVKIPMIALKEIVIGPKSPRYTDAYIESILIDKNINLDGINIVDSLCPLK